MPFKANLLKKLEIKKMARNISAAIAASSSGQRIDMAVMRQLVEYCPYDRHDTRDLTLYLMPSKNILVLDNELAVYQTSIEDVALRKSPTIKEMINIRNAIKILNDSKVIVSKKAKSLAKVVADAIASLDLTFKPQDIDEIRREGIVSIDNGDTKGVIEALSLLVEVLDFQPPPAPFNLKNHHIAGVLAQKPSGKKTFGPLTCYFPADNRLFLIKTPLEIGNTQDMTYFKQVVDGEEKPTVHGAAVFQFLQETILELDSNRA